LVEGGKNVNNQLDPLWESISDLEKSNEVCELEIPIKIK
jgi:hypothetical protein